MDLGTTIASVIDATGRPDREVYIRSQLNSVLRFIHAQYDFELDLVESQEPVSNTATIINLAVPANLRKIEYLRPLPFAKLLDHVRPSRVIRSDLKQELKNVYYVSGTTIIINLRTGYGTDTIAFGRFEYPTMPVADTDETWSMIEFDSLIVDILAAKVFRVTGDINSARGLEEGPTGINARIALLRETGQLNTVLMGT